MRAGSLLQGAALSIVTIGAALSATTKTVESLGGVPLAFEESRPGSPVPYIARGLGYGIGIGPAAAEIRLGGPRSERTPPAGSALFTLRFPGADPDAVMEMADPQPGVSHYFVGADSKQWRTGVRHYGR